LSYFADLPKARAITEGGDVELDTVPTTDKKRTAHQILVTRVLEGDGRASRAERRAAFDNTGLAEPLRTLIDKVAKRPTQVTEKDVANVEASGLSEDQIFELVICAAIGQATRQYETALEALAEAMTSKESNEHATSDPQ
jgi:alkylhydroperoxidase family enzyme